MQLSWIKFVIVLALATYLSGPLFETVDRWDNFQQGTGDMVLSLSAAVTFLAAGFAFVIGLRRRMRARPAFSKVVLDLSRFIANFSNFPLLRLPTNFHSPPLFLRI